MGILPALFLVFLTLKLTNYIDWSWWWIASPLIVTTLIILIQAFHEVVLDGTASRTLRSFKKKS